MKKLILFLVLSGFSQFTFSQQNISQEKIPTRSAYLELGGAGVIYSFNYDFRFNSQKMDSWGMRVGVGGYSTSNDSFFSLPVVINKLYGRGPHFFEMGLGLTFLTFDEGSFSNSNYCVSGSFDSNGNYVCLEYSDDAPYQIILPVDSNPTLMGTMNIGYRRVPVNGGFTWKASLTPVFNNNGFWPLFFGVGLGYAF
jgi:hypothetical protein